MSNSFVKEMKRVKADRKKLEIAMATACMNSEDLQKAADMPRPTLNNVISGRNVRPGTIGRIAKALGCRVTEILIED
ncbi:helix-turn-helix domain-containing protein [Anaerocolumna xylanovorans]|uniref:Cro/C1-type HTH DNA-binding domain-containing protein n=1 Tax=Anaerocolumna xylanovorans DSM 12503 TaxID=1121345 RepID=A0A1M7Y3P3_9FIRM|nr:helix-turn-helix transcriptional regulator [Anaerocolumna xylanovorans]SHO46822.1 Cro/C1-type HTH DNA-binding domain-containing protein [Anaerocolumna xylanovorans DSM 12503]